MGIINRIKLHHLKTVNPYFTQIWDRKKLFEVRKNDRNFKKGDMLLLIEIEAGESYTGRSILAEVTSVVQEEKYGIKREYCIMGINPLYNFMSR